MNFLPFVFTFLILLSLMSSFLFSSAFRTARESKLIETKHQTYLTLLSKQANESFTKKKNETTRTDENTTIKKPKKPASSPGTNDKPPRSFHDGCEESKINLAFLYEAANPELQFFLKQTVVRLIELLYGSCDFYKAAGIKDTAFLIVKELMKEKIESLEDLKFDNPALDAIYYKMLVGTNTGYPSLHEYVRFREKTFPPINFRYAPKQILQAALGDELSKTVFEMEIKEWQKKKSLKALERKAFEELAISKVPTTFNTTLINAAFRFKNDKKSPLQIHREANEKIRAVHRAQSLL
ncbi:MAG: hypothetical protein KBA81_05305 [Rhabdochlamydiaceae bacterium]|nr:hypothetical protein [Rhabdochlamydiaceae bacterium]